MDPEKEKLTATKHDLSPDHLEDHLPTLSQPAVQHDHATPITHIYKRRWLMLFLFSILSLSNAMLWITYAPITRLVTSHCHVSSLEVACMSLIYMGVYIFFVWPGI